MMKFEETYKQNIESEVPDLWDRIEAGIDAIEAKENDTDSVNKTATPDISSTTDVKTIDTTVSFTEYKKKHFNYKAVTIIVAVAAVFLLGIAVINNPLRNFNSSPTAESPASMANVYEAATEAPCEASVEPPAEVHYDMAPTEEVGAEEASTESTKREINEAEAETESDIRERYNIFLDEHPNFFFSGEFREEYATGIYADNEAQLGDTDTIEITALTYDEFFVETRLYFVLGDIYTNEYIIIDPLEDMELIEAIHYGDVMKYTISQPIVNEDLGCITYSVEKYEDLSE